MIRMRLYFKTRINSNNCRVSFTKGMIIKCFTDVLQQIMMYQNNDFKANKKIKQFGYTTNYLPKSTENAQHLVLSNYLTKTTISNYTVDNSPLA